jgi:hypothetical protein
MQEWKQSQHKFLRAYGQLRAKQEAGAKPFNAEAIKELQGLFMQAHDVVKAGSEAKRVARKDG